MVSRLILTLFIGVVALGLIGCGGKEDQGSGGLTVSVTGEATSGNDVGLRVISDDTLTGVENAVITLNGEEVVGKTDADGRITLTIPQDAADVSIIATYRGLKGALRIELPEVEGDIIGAADANRVDANFRFLVSDDVNAIEDFRSLDIVIASIGIQEGGESGKWREFAPQVDEVDLTQLQGANAQEIWSGNLDPGTYSKVFLYVDQVTGVLKAGGDPVGIKLPSNKLQINLPFEVTASSTIDYVYDLTVVAAGNERAGSIKYILKPQIGQSGTGQKLSVIKGNQEREGLTLSLEGEAEQGQDVGLLVTSEDTDTAVENAVVTLDGEEAGSTDADGLITLTIPEDATEVKVVATFGELTGQLEVEFPETQEAYQGTTETAEPKLTLNLEGEAEQGQDVDVLVTSEDTDTGVENAVVTMDGEKVGSTDADGRITLTMPEDATEVKIVATSGELTGELEIEFSGA